MCLSCSWCYVALADVIALGAVLGATAATANQVMLILIVVSAGQGATAATANQVVWQPCYTAQYNPSILKWKKLNVVMIFSMINLIVLQCI